MITQFIYEITSDITKSVPLRMKTALVPIKRVVDYAVKVRVRPDKKGIELGNVKMSMNPFCEIAVEEALRLREKGGIKEVIAMSIGPEKAQETLRQALAMGADRAIHIHTGILDLTIFSPLIVAQLIQKVAEKEKPDIVLLGKQSIDGDNNQTGQLLAGLMKWPQAAFASSITVENSSLVVMREVDSGVETVRLEPPCVITADLRLNVPRFATLPNLMKAKKKPLESIDVTTLGIDLTARIEVLSVTEPPARKAGIKVASVDELIDKLRNEAKVI